MQTTNGQYYFQLAFLIAVVIYGIWRNTRSWDVLSGVCLACLVLIRPTALILAIAFFFVFMRRKSFIFSCSALLIVYGFFVFTSPFQLSLWEEYLAAIRLHGEFHLNISDTGGNQPFYIIENLEGFNKHQVERIIQKSGTLSLGENSNFYYWLQRSGIAVNSTLMNAFSILLLCISAAIVWFRKSKMQPNQIILLGLIIYLLLDFTSPVYRGGYVGVQFLVLTHFLVALFTQIDKGVLIVIGLSIFLQILPIQLLPMQHTISEALIILAGLYMALKSKKIAN
jgi:hypothetical protein